MKNKLLIICICFLSSVVNAQERGVYFGNTKYFDKNWKSCSKSKAIFSRLIIKPSPDSLYKVTEQYKSSAIFSTYSLSSLVPLIMQGAYLRFSESGVLLEKGEYKDGEKVGLWNCFYLNAKPKTEIKYTFINKQRGFSILNAWDSLGVKVVDNGTGLFKSYNNGKLEEEGPLVNSAKEGTWTGFYESGDKRYEEIYKEGRFISGIAFNKQGVKTPYTQSYSDALPEGGMTAFYSEILNHLIIPDKLRYETNKCIWISFLVNSEGKIKNVELLQGIEAEFDLKIVNKIAYSDTKWKPAMIHGTPIDYTYTIPITINFNQESPRMYTVPNQRGY
ncbi:hypothetical protein NF867_08440 [Solitalea sp. MAHUQ-68]|uniref:TonB C-terminal domain-containing protein n=1 Tax=Solitalea agri TaxID=2953739 RepID=A0A9X2JEY8_9SPHI|nr:hypothetical protein [Solitalea agri]MCO4292886.1 hypothetical protein [Solitalea agri]